VKQTTQTWKA